MTPESGLTKVESPEVVHARELARASQNLPAAVLAGAIAALLSAAVWAAITFFTEYQIGFMAIGVGIAVALAVRTFGHGIDPIFAFVGGALAILGCIVGNVLTGCAFIAASQEVSIFQAIDSLDWKILKAIMVATTSPMDLLFYGIAAYEGFRLSRSPVPVPEAPAA